MSDRMYISDIENNSPEDFYTDEAVRTVIKDYRESGDEDLHTAIVHNYGKYVVSIAKNYQDQGLPLADLISEGMIGLINAIDKFDIENITKFVTYSNTVISRQIREALDEFNYPTKVPKNIRNEIHKAKELQHRMAMEGKSNDDVINTVAENSGDERAYNRYSRYVMNPGLYRGVNLSEKLSDEDESYTLEALMQSDSADPDALLVAEDLRSDIQRIFKSELTSTEINVLQLYYGLDGESSIISTEEIGSRLGLTGERARQLKESGLKKLRSDKCRKILIKYLS